jgi:ATP phosphoribosyltransferase regulatory subunit
VTRRRRSAVPSGAAAYAFEEASRRREAEERVVAGLRSAGYREAMVPAADYLAPYSTHIGQREERELYRFVDRHGDTLALRADFTIAVARHLAPRLSSDAASRVFYRGEVLRAASARDGSGAEFFQIGAELLGEPGAEADLEVVERCLDALTAAGLEELHVVLSAVGGIEASLRGSVPPEVLPVLADAVRRRRLADARRLARPISREAETSARRLIVGDIPADDPVISTLDSAGRSLCRVSTGLRNRAGCRVAIDLAEPAPRSYYTGFFFSVYGASGGEPVAGGGRYDELYGAFGTPRPAVGFALGLEGALAG